MRVTISHNKTKAQVTDSVNKSFDQLFSGIAVGPVQFLDQKREWAGDRLNFSLTAQMGFLKSPIVGWVEVGDKDVTVDVDLGILGNLISQDKAKAQLESRIKGLLT